MPLVSISGAADHVDILDVARFDDDESIGYCFDIQVHNNNNIQEEEDDDDDNV